MDIDTYFWIEAGPWITKTDGHVDKKEFLQAALDDSFTKQVLCDEDMSEENIEVSHIYIKRLTYGTREYEDNVGETCDSAIMVHIECGPDDEGAEPVTAIKYEF